MDWNIALGGRVGLIRYGTEDRLLPQGFQFDSRSGCFSAAAIERSAGLGGGRMTRAGGAFDEPPRAVGDQVRLLSPQFAPRRPIHADEPGRVARQFFPQLPRVGTGLSADSRRAAVRRSRLRRVHLGRHPALGVSVRRRVHPCSPHGAQGAPFLAVNAHLREEVNFGGGLTVQTGWAWRVQAAICSVSDWSTSTASPSSTSSPTTTNSRSAPACGHDF